MKRVLALVGAILLVVVAVVLRGVLDDDGGDDDRDPVDGGDEPSLVVACVPELEAACLELARDDAEVLIVTPTETITRLERGEHIDAWVTLDPWPAMAAFTLDDDPFLAGEPAAVASTELVLLTRTAAVADCAEPVTWTCAVDTLGDDAALPIAFSTLRPFVLGQAVTDWFGATPATNDFGEPAIDDRLGEVGTPAGDPLRDIKDGLPQPSATGVLATQLRALGSRLTDFTTSPSGVPVTVAAVVVGPEADRVAGEPAFTGILEATGWTIDPAAATTGLPDPGVLVALSDRVR